MFIEYKNKEYIIGNTTNHYLVLHLFYFILFYCFLLLLLRFIFIIPNFLEFRIIIIIIFF